MAVESVLVGDCGLAFTEWNEVGTCVGCWVIGGENIDEDLLLVEGGYYLVVVVVDSKTDVSKQTWAWVDRLDSSEVLNIEDD